MIIYYGVCKSCSYVWEVLARMPNHCPECGSRLFNSNEEMLIASKKKRIHDCREHQEPKDFVHDMGQ